MPDIPCKQTPDRTETGVTIATAQAGDGAAADSPADSGRAKPKKRMMTARWPLPVGGATMAADMCPRCKGDNTEGWALCAACQALEAVPVGGSGELERAAEGSSKPADGLSTAPADPALREAIREAVWSADDGRFQVGAVERVTTAVLAAIQPALDRLAADQERYEEETVGNFNQQAINLARRAGQAEAEREEARATNRRLNLRCQQAESENATYRRAVAQWDAGERGTYIPHASLVAIGKAAGTDLLGSPRHLAHFERVQQTEAVVERVRQIDPDKLDLLADWFDTDDAHRPGGRDITVQADLRRWARELRTLTPRADRPGDGSA